MGLQRYWAIQWHPHNAMRLGFALKSATAARCGKRQAANSELEFRKRAPVTSSCICFFRV